MMVALINKKCRICLEENGGTFGISKHIESMNKFLPITIDKNDGKGDRMCKKCIFGVTVCSKLVQKYKDFKEIPEGDKCYLCKKDNVGFQIHGRLFRLIRKFESSLNLKNLLDNEFFGTAATSNLMYRLQSRKICQECFFMVDTVSDLYDHIKNSDENIKKLVQETEEWVYGQHPEELAEHREINQQSGEDENGEGEGEDEEGEEDEEEEEEEEGEDEEEEELEDDPDEENESSVSGQISCNDETSSDSILKKIKKEPSASVSKAPSNIKIKEEKPDSPSPSELDEYTEIKEEIKEDISYCAICNAEIYDSTEELCEVCKDESSDDQPKKTNRRKKTTAKKRPSEAASSSAEGAEPENTVSKKRGRKSGKSAVEM